MEMEYVCEIFEDVLGEWRWRLVAKNGQVVGGCGEGYVERKHAVRMALQIFTGAEAVSVEVGG